jgi:G3E family GTPase
MKQVPSIFFIGGFLGAGKTSAIKALAKVFADRGLTSAAITNDQAAGLVDTFFLTEGGLPAEEVAGSCFCCNFNGLSDAIQHCIERAAPHVILAEPVGSCTDIVATVIRPMRAFMRDKVNVRAYSVLVEPARWQQLGRGAGEAVWSMRYLFERQVEEADFVVLTKLDTISDNDAGQILGQLGGSFPRSKALGISSKAGLGLEEWVDAVQSSEPGERWLTDIDYDRYAKAEAEMGWLNAEAVLSFPRPVQGRSIAEQLAQALLDGVNARNGHVGHIKFLLVGDTGSFKAGITQSGHAAELEGAFSGPTSSVQVTVNIRATVSPGELAEILTDSIGRFRHAGDACADIAAIHTFRPGAPRPTYRLHNRDRSPGKEEEKNSTQRRREKS